MPILSMLTPWSSRTGSMVAMPGNPASADHRSPLPIFRSSLFATWSVPTVSMTPFRSADHMLWTSLFERMGGTTLPVRLAKSTVCVRYWGQVSM